jgi:hypothetical protein
MQSHAKSGHGQKWKAVLSISLQKKIRNVVGSMLQQMKHVGTKCFNSDFHLFNWKHVGKVYYESGIFRGRVSSVLKIFTIERSYGKSWFKSVGPELGNKILWGNLRVKWIFFEPESQNIDTKRASLCWDVWNLLWFRRYPNCQRRGQSHSKLLALFRAAQYFQQSKVFMHVELVWKHETGH